jgi:hypothetical protein
LEYRRRVEQVLWGWERVLAPVGVGGDGEERGKRMNMAQIMYIHYVNAKMIPVETVPGIGGRRNEGEELEGVNSSMIYLIHCKNLCKSYTVSPSNTTIKK